MPKISVIVPVYNTEKYLRQCIDSILAQTFTDFELLLINDGSTDGSGAICDEYAQKDSRVRVFHQENGGVSSARNVGLDNARGEWITFCDSDDTIDESFLETMIEDCNQNIDLIVSTMNKSGKIDSEYYVERLLRREYPPQLWGKLYRRKILDKVLCLPREIYWGEDLIQNVLVGLNLRGDVLLKPVCLYNYEINDNSISKKRKSSLEYESFYIKVLEEILGDNKIQLWDGLCYTKLYILEDLIVCKNMVNYDLPWIKELKKWSKVKPLTLRQKIVIRVKNNIICRYLLALERRISMIISK